jgi:hypothetical protein
MLIHLIVDKKKSEQSISIKLLSSGVLISRSLNIAVFKARRVRQWDDVSISQFYVKYRIKLNEWDVDQWERNSINAQTIKLQLAHESSQRYYECFVNFKLQISPSLNLKIFQIFHTLMESSVKQIFFARNNYELFFDENIVDVDVMID